MTRPTLYATPELVAIAWLSAQGLTAAGVGAQLPADESSWGSADGTPGYVTVPAVAGGTPGSNAPVQRPVLQVTCWATVPGSDSLPWNVAANLAEQVRIATYDRTGASGRPLTLPGQYPVAWVRSATILTHARRAWSDAGDYAGYTFNLGLIFVAEGERIP